MSQQDIDAANARAALEAANLKASSATDENEKLKVKLAATQEENARMRRDLEAAKDSNATVIPEAKALEEGELQAAGTAGGPFAVYGLGLGEKGTLTVSGRTLETTAWYTRVGDNTTVIKAVLPRDVKNGEVVVQSKSGQTFTGYLGKKPAAKK